MSHKLIFSAMTIYWEHAMSIDLLTQLKDLRLYGMNDAWAEIKAEAPQRQKELSS